MKNKIEYVGFAYNLDDIEVEFIVNGVKKNLYIYSKGIEDILTFMDYQENEDEEGNQEEFSLENFQSLNMYMLKNYNAIEVTK